MSIPSHVIVTNRLPIQEILLTGHEHFEETLLDAFGDDLKTQAKDDLKPYFKAVQLFHELDYETKPLSFAFLFDRIGFLFKSKSDEAAFITEGDQKISSCLKQIDLNEDNERFGRLLCHLYTESKIPVQKSEELPSFAAKYKPSICTIVFVLDSNSQDTLKYIHSSARISLCFYEISPSQISKWVEIFRTHKQYAEQVIELLMNDDTDDSELIALLPNCK